VYSPNDQADRNAVEVLRLAPRFRQASKAIAFLVSVLGLVVFCGWVFNVPSLTYIRPTLQSMKVNTTLSFLCLGAGLWLADNDERQGIRRVLGLLVIIIAGSTLAEYAFHISLGIDQLLLRDTRTPSLSAYPGRMAIATAICFLFLGFAVMLLGLKKALALQRSLVVACFGLSLAALCGYLYGVKSLYSITPYSTMGVHTSAGLMAVCLAYFLARPNEGIVSVAASDSNSGFLVRTLVPAIVVLPILIGWLSLVGHRRNLYDTPFGAPLLVLASIGCLAVLTILVARSMYRWECESFHAEKTIRESEKRFRLVADTAPVMIWMSGTDKLCTYVNQPWLEFTGRPLEDALGNGWAEGVHPEDFSRCMDTYTQAFDRREPFQMEYRLRRHDGAYRWFSAIGVPRFNPDHFFAGYIGSATDVTGRKLAEESLADVGRKLIEAHEEERTWIARELHDDVNQRMALLANELERWKQQLPPSAVEFHDHIRQAIQRLSDIAKDIQALSHRLHSSKLEYLGLVVAAKSFCNELSEQQKVEIDFKHTAVPRSVPKEISLCVFRVIQESLQNAVKHSGVRHFKVELCGTEGAVQLTVSDLGVGFDPQDAVYRRGIGLISMRERVQLVSGEFSIKSRPGSGTTIHARVPFDSRSDSARAAG
jgi:PAS domain S-box-containing protein